jgi:nucleotide-binding universal stress UspA family protein
MNPDKKLIIWAVDPFAEDQEFQRNTAIDVEKLARFLPAEVEPIYIFQSYSLDPTVDLQTDLLHQIYDSAQQGLDTLVEGTSLASDIRPLTILSEPFLTLKQGVQELIQHAKENQASLIVVSTAAKKGIQKWVMGSFAETLILLSDVPLFIVNPQSSLETDFTEVIFATDFSDESKGAYLQLLDFATSLKSKITLFNKLNYDFTPGIETAFYQDPAYKDAIQDRAIIQQEKGQDWVKLAQERGVAVQFHLDMQVTGAAADAILDYAKFKKGIIAMASHSGPMATVFLGGTTRRVVRNSNLPVWVIHPQKAQRAERKRDLRPRPAILSRKEKKRSA